MKTQAKMRGRGMPVRPPRLRPGDTVGIVAPSSPVPQEVLEGTARWWRERGYRVTFGVHVRRAMGHLAGTAEERATDLMAMYADPEVRAIVPAMGGRGAAQLLPLLDYRAIRRQPKVLLALSDPSALALAIVARSGVVAMHGPTGVNFGLTGVTRYTEEALWRAVADPAPLGKCPLATPWRALRAGPAVEGPLLGGHLGTLRALVGTPFAPDWRGAILFLEEFQASLPEVDAALTHLRLAGVLDRIAGLVWGRPVEVLGGWDEAALPHLVAVPVEGGVGGQVACRVVGVADHPRHQALGDQRALARPRPRPTARTRPSCARIRPSRPSARPPGSRATWCSRAGSSRPRPSRSICAP